MVPPTVDLLLCACMKIRPTLSGDHHMLGVQVSYPSILKRSLTGSFVPTRPKHITSPQTLSTQQTTVGGTMIKARTVGSDEKLTEGPCYNRGLGPTGKKNRVVARQDSSLQLRAQGRRVGEVAEAERQLGEADASAWRS